MVMKESTKMMKDYMNKMKGKVDLNYWLGRLDSENMKYMDEMGMVDLLMDLDMDFGDWLYCFEGDRILFKDREIDRFKEEDHDEVYDLYRDLIKLDDVTKDTVIDYWDYYEDDEEGDKWLLKELKKLRDKRIKIWSRLEELRK